MLFIEEELFQVMCRHVNLTLSGYEIVPCGSHSFIRVTKPDKKVVECRLYGTGSWKPFGDAQLDQGIVAYVKCFCQLETKLKEIFPKVGGLSIKLVLYLIRGKGFLKFSRPLLVG
jgi:hypothetical protein